MQSKIARTDLAVESHHLAAEGKTIDGVDVTAGHIHNFPFSCVVVKEDKAASLLEKPIGKYVTLELDSYINRRENSFADAANAISEIITDFYNIKTSDTVLIVCLGNPLVTPDALGPLTADATLVTRHLKLGGIEAFADFASVAVFRSGVLGTTGIESAVSLKALCAELKPDFVIAVDALASADLSRLCKNVQICDTGIAPGSGVGNDRVQIDSKLLGVPVIAVGVPTVTDASTFSDNDEAKGLFVTPRNIDELVRSTAKLIAYGINLALHKGISVEDLDLLLE